MIYCKKCKKEIPDGSLYCMHCGKKQESKPQPRTHKRAHGTGTISKDMRNKKPFVAHAPATRSGKGRVYIGAYATRKEAQEALDEYIANGRPNLYNATFGDIYRLWSESHFSKVSKSAVNLYTAMRKRFEPIEDIKMADIRSVHIQEIVNTGTSKSACNTLRAMAKMICKYAMQNDLVTKNYADFVTLPKFDKVNKRIFTAEEREILWAHSDDKCVQIILIMIYTGFRIGEIEALKAVDVHLEEGYIIGGIKTQAGKNRVVPIPQGIPEIKVFLSALMEASDGGNLLGMTADKFRRFHFYPTLIKLNIIKGEESGGKYKISEENHITPHSTRHTFATLAATSGIKADSLQKIIGHSDYQTTANIYVHSDTQKLICEMAKLSK